MAATNRLFVDFISGVTDVALSAGDTTISGPFLADLPAVADPDFIALILDPEFVGGNPEVVWVTAHTAGATTATIQRGKEGTSARAHVSGIKVVAALTADAIKELEDATAAAQQTADVAVPIGAILHWTTSTPPTGFLRCDGSLVSRTTYAKLFAVIGTTFGAGDGSTTFALPDLRGRTIFGLGSSPLNTIGNTGGTFNHTHNVPSHTHSMSHTHTINPPSTATTSAGSHTHSIGNTGSAGNHNHTVPLNGTTGGFFHVYGDHPDANLGARHTTNTSTNGSHTHSVPNTNSAGAHTHNVDIAPFTSGGSSASNTGSSGTLETTGSNPPYFVLMPIIRAF